MAVVPPTRLSGALIENDAPVGVSESGRAGGIGSDPIADDLVARGRRSVDQDSGAPLPEMTLPAPVDVPPIVLSIAPESISTPS